MQGIGAVIRSATRPVTGVVTGILAASTRTGADLLIENALLRQQLIVTCRHVKQPNLPRHERTAGRTRPTRS